MYDRDDGLLTGPDGHSSASENDYVPNSGMNVGMNSSLNMSQDYASMPSMINNGMSAIQSGSLTPSQLITTHSGLVNR